MNYYYVYAATWVGTAVLYSLGLSELNQPLSILLVLFLVVLVSISAVMGYAQRDSFTYRGFPIEKLDSWIPVLLCVALFGITFAIQGYIPLIAVLFFGFDYEQLVQRVASVPATHTIAVVLGIVFAVLYYMRALETKAARDYLRVACFIALFLLCYQRSLLMIALTGCLFAHLSKYHEMIRGKKAVGVVLTAVVCLWIFGVLGNIRQGGTWNDASYMMHYGLFEESWPAFLPKQFSWAYSYVTSPLACTNYNVSLGIYSFDLVNYLYSFLPASIARRLPFYMPADIALQVSYFTASTIWSTYYYYAGPSGMFIGLVIQLLMLRMGRWVVRNTAVETLATVLMCVMVAFTFFTNSFANSLTSYAVIACIGYAAYEKLFSKNNSKTLVTNRLDIR